MKIMADSVDLFGSVTSAFSGFSTDLLGLAGIGVGVALVAWGVPRGVRFIKKLAG